MRRVLGLDPGLRRTGWGIISFDGAHLRYVASGRIAPEPRDGLAGRLRVLHEQLCAVLDEWHPAEAALEEVFLNRNPLTSLALGQARGIALLAVSRLGSPGSYAARTVKQAVAGTGTATKAQIAYMIGVLLGGGGALPHSRSEDENDALAVAICHAHHAHNQSALRQNGLGQTEFAPAPLSRRKA